MMGMETALKTCLVIFLVALVLSAILVGLRTTALKSAYDSGKAFNITDSDGEVHTVAASGVSADTTALIYGILIGLIWFFAVIGMLFVVVKSFKMK